MLRGENRSVGVKVDVLCTRNILRWQRIRPLGAQVADLHGAGFVKSGNELAVGTEFAIDRCALQLQSFVN